MSAFDEKFGGDARLIEGLLSPHKARAEPWRVMVLAALFVFAAALVSIFVPSLQGGVIVFALIPAVPLMWTLVMEEEHHDPARLKLLGASNFKYHEPIITAFAFFFLGSALAYCALYAILPAPVGQPLFSAQTTEIQLIGASVQNGENHPTALAFRKDFAWGLFSHNLVVLVAMFAFCLLYGMGSVYLLLWNASVLGVFVGTRLQSGGVSGFLASSIALIPHGVPEIGAYLLASIAGGILSAALIRRHHGRKEFAFIAADVALLTLCAVALLGMGALLEAA